MSNYSTLTDVTLTLKRLQIVSVLSSLSLFLYDYFVTLQLEVKFIWTAPWRFMKITYLMTRYFPIVDTSLALIGHLCPHLSAKDCHNLLSITVWINIVGMSIAEAVMSIKTARFNSQGLISRGCIFTEKISTLVSIEWALLLVYNIVVMAFMLIPAIDIFKKNGRSQLTKVMYRDGIIYYIFLIILSLANLLAGLIFECTMP
ncbi:hypothetical protein BDQ17DRAFT_1334361 [Cyathus striatus]|nr:hypothetical protein BDQ17DRAFT_1334361 [Cyathus striatus]